MPRIVIRGAADLNTTRFTRGISTIRGAASGLLGIFARVGGAFGLGGGLAIGSIVRKAIALGSEMSDLADQSGLTTDEFQALEAAALEAGVGKEKLRSAASRLRQAQSRAIATNGKERQSLAALGITQDQLSGSSAQLFELVARGSIETGNFAATYDILGRSAATLQEVLRRLATEGFEGLENSARAAGLIIESQTIQQLDAMADRIEVLKRKTTLTGATFVEFAAKSASSLKDFVGAFFNAEAGLSFNEDLARRERERRGEINSTILKLVEQREAEQALREGQREQSNQSALDAAQQKIDKALFDRLTKTEQIAALEQQIANIAPAIEIDIPEDDIDALKTELDQLLTGRTGLSIALVKDLSEARTELAGLSNELNNLPALPTDPAGRGSVEGGLAIDIRRLEVLQKIALAEKRIADLGGTAAPASLPITAELTKLRDTLALLEREGNIDLPQPDTDITPAQERLRIEFRRKQLTEEIAAIEAVKNPVIDPEAESRITAIRNQLRGIDQASKDAERQGLENQAQRLGLENQIQKLKEKGAQATKAQAERQSAVDLLFALRQDAIPDADLDRRQQLENAPINAVNQPKNQDVINAVQRNLEEASKSLRQNADIQIRADALAQENTRAIEEMARRNNLNLRSILAKLPDPTRRPVPDAACGNIPRF